MTMGRKVFVIHGRDKRARRELFTFLRAIGLAPIEWTEALAEAGGGAPLISDILDTVITADRAFIVLLTPDDLAQLKPEHADDEDDPEVRPSGQARPNVLFEAGMAFGRNPENTVLVEFGKVRRFTDVSGRFVVKLDNSSQSRTKLALRLKAIGCEVDLGGTDWLSAGDLTPPETRPIPPTQPAAATPAQNMAALPISGAVQPEFTSNAGTWNIEMENFTINRRRRSSLVVHGEITNHEPNVLMILLKATFFDADGIILGSADGIVNKIGKEERRAFELTTSDWIENFIRIHVHVDTGLEV